MIRFIRTHIIPNALKSNVKEKNITWYVSIGMRLFNCTTVFKVWQKKTQIDFCTNKESDLHRVFVWKPCWKQRERTKQTSDSIGNFATFIYLAFSLFILVISLIAPFLVHFIYKNLITNWAVVFLLKLHLLLGGLLLLQPMSSTECKTISLKHETHFVLWRKTKACKIFHFVSFNLMVLLLCFPSFDSCCF